MTDANGTRSATGARLRRGLRAAVALAWLGMGAGCVFYPTVESDPPALPPEPTEGEPLPPASPAPTAAEENLMPPADAAAPAPPAREEAPPAEALPAEVLVLYSGGVPAHAGVAAKIEQVLSAGPYRVRRISVAAARAEHMTALRDQPHLHAVAVGLEAAQLAMEELAIPTVFCQIFNYQPLLNGHAALWGIASIPPLALQLQTWRLIDPSLARIGMIVGPGQEDLVREALDAGRAAGVAVRYEHSSSDRQTLYHFRRLSREIDGLWLFPDNRILSPGVIAEMLAQAQAAGLQVVTFNAAALPPGALMNASAAPADVADTVSRVLARLVAGETQELPAVTGLSTLDIDVDQERAARLGLALPAHFGEGT